MTCVLMSQICASSAHAVCASVGNNEPICYSVHSIPDDFRGKITYNGHVRGDVTMPGHRKCKDIMDCGQIVPINGTYQATIEFNGGDWVASERTYTQVGGEANNVLHGTKRGDICRFFWEGQGISARCTREGFFYYQDNFDNKGNHFRLNIESNLSQLDDYAGRGRQHAVVTAQIPDAPDQEQSTTEPNTQPRQIDVMTSYFDDIVAQDAERWVKNSYDRNSMHNLKIAPSTNSKAKTILYGEYTFNNGQFGWVKAQFANQKLVCLEFWDYPEQCRPLGGSPSRDVAVGVTAVLATALAAAVISGTTSSDNENPETGGKCDVRTGQFCTSDEINQINTDRFYLYQQQQQQQQHE
ncbi:MAG: hypothetical protein NW204_02745 [Xanthomonadaceae bacterium]|nr:hypothetical protein [Xanthomonadaceae bacterium]